VAIDKKLRLGGMENSPPKADQSPERFKVANNVTFTDEGYLTPRPSMTGFTGNTVGAYDIERWTMFSSYKSVVDGKYYPVKLGISDQAGFRFKHLFLDNTLVPSNASLGSLGSVYDATYVNNFCDQSVEINNIKYILSSPSRTDCKLLKYDGYEACTAGIGVPYFIPVAGSNSSLEPAYSTTTGSKYVKVIGHSLDMQGNPITSDPVSYRTTGFVQGINALASGQDQYGKSIIVGVGDQGIVYSYNGIDWDSNVRYNYFDNPRQTSFGGVCYGTPSGVKTFIAVNNDAAITQDPFWLSNDGINWRRISNLSTLAKGGGWSSVIWAGNQFVAVRKSGGTAAEKVATSPDGEVWTYQTAIAASSWTSVTYGGPTGSEVYVAVASDGTTTTNLMYSSDAITWTSATSIAANQWNSVTWGGRTQKRFMAVSGNGTTSNNVMDSSDGITWSPTGTSAAANNWKCVIWNSTVGDTSGYYVAVSATASTANKIMYSSNGNVWTGVTGPNSLPHSALCSFSDGTNKYTITGAALTATSGSTKGSMYSEYTDLTSWTETDTPVSTKIDLSRPEVTVNSFLTNTNNASYYDVSDMNPYFYGKATYNSGTGRFDLTTSFTSNIWGTDNWGLKTINGDVYLIRTVHFTISSGAALSKYGAIAYKYNSTGNYFEGNIKIYNLSTVTWEDSTGAALSVASGVFVAARRHFTIWASVAPTGIYYYKGSVAGGTYNLSSYFASVVYTIDIRALNIENAVQKATYLPFSISGQLDAWYDVVSFKSSFNDFNRSLNPYVAITIYQGLLLLADSENLYFSDYTNGGSFEMKASEFGSIGDSQHGRIVSIVGTKDYLIVSRERKVYMVAGAIATDNTRIQEIPDIPVGAYSNTSMIEIYGTILMVASSGAWLINAANSKKVSSQIALNFKSFMVNTSGLFSTAEQDSIGLNMNNYPTNAYEYPTSLSGYVPRYLIAVFDSFKAKVIITDNNLSKGGQSLVFHTNNAEWTTYNGYDSFNGYGVTAMSFVNGIMYVGSYKESNKTARTSKEDFSTYTYDYYGRSPARLVTTWMTQGEPSLEKQLLQVKIFGYLLGRLSVKHYENWNINSAITDTFYTPSSNYVMYHKQRLNSSKPMAAAIELTGVDSNNPFGQTFWIEGLEVEFESIQQGMKR
jgi:hypothetical protein